MNKLVRSLGLMALLIISIGACTDRQDVSDTPESPVVDSVEGENGEEAGEEAVDESAGNEAAEEAGGDEKAKNLAFDEAPSGGTLVIGQGQEPDSLYLYGTGMLAATHILNSIYDGPIDTLDFDYQPVILTHLPKIEDEGSGASLDMVSVEAGGQYVDPVSQEVVTATEQVDDLPQLTVVFTLVDGLAWQDGTPVTAADSELSRNLACDPNTPTSKFVCDRTTSYSALDERQVEWVSLPGFTDQTYYSNFYTPLPGHQPSADGSSTLAEMPAAAVLDDEAFARAPYSYGPFMIENWTSGGSVNLTRNPNYWRSDEGLPFADGLVHQFIPDANALVAAVRTGDIDVATRDGLDISLIDNLDEAAAAGELVPHYVTGTTWEHMDFNLRPVDDRPSFLTCPEVRQAVAHATDRETMATVVMKGKTRVQHTFVPVDHWAYPPEDMIVAYDYDPEAAGALLDGLGIIDADGDGIREVQEDLNCDVVTDLEGATETRTIPAGTPLEIEVSTTSGRPYREQTTLLMQQDLTDVGIGVNLEYRPANIFFEDGPDGPVFGRRFDIGEYAFSFGVMPPISRYYCSDIPSPENQWAGGNSTGWCNATYDRAGKTAENTIERAAALAEYHAAQQEFMRDMPVLGLYARVNVMATRPDLVNFSPNPSATSSTWNIESWGIASDSQE